MLETLNILRRQQLKLAIVTNGLTSLQSAAIRALEIERMFDAIVISETEGVKKPAPRIYEIAMERIGVSASESVFVGDHPDTDIRGAQRAGLCAIWKRDDFWGDCTFADAVIDTLAELPGALARVAASLHRATSSPGER